MNTFWKMIAGAAAALISGGATALAQPIADPAPPPPIVKVGYRLDNPPTQFIAGFRPAGAAVDLMGAIAEDAGFLLEFVPVTATNSQGMLDANLIDLAIGTQFTQADRDAGREFSDPVWVNTEQPVVLKADTTQYTGWEDFRGQAVATTNASYFDELQASGLFSEVRRSTSLAELYLAVLTGQVKVGFVPSVNLRTQIDNHPLLRPVDSYEPRIVTEYGFSFRNADADLVDQVNRSMERLKANGITTAIFREHRIEFALAE
jgi:polar amino acid transport system substrate-binding protein